MLSLKQFQDRLDEGNPLARLYKHTQEGRHFAVVSAHRGSDEATPEQNQKRHEELKKKLTAQGYAHKEVEGHWEGGKEKSILVHAKGAGKEHGQQLYSDIKKHGQDYNQDSILYHDHTGGKLHGTNETGYPGKGKTAQVGQMRFNKPEAPFQTEMKPKSDKPLKPGRTSKGSARFTTQSKFGS